MGYHYLMRSGNVYVKHWLAIAISVATVCVYFLQNTLQSALFNIDLRSTGVKTWGGRGGINSEVVRVVVIFQNI